MRRHISANLEPAGPPLAGHKGAAMTAPSSINSLRPEYKEMTQAISVRGNTVLPATCQISSKFMCSYAFCKSWTLPAAQNPSPL